MPSYQTIFFGSPAREDTAGWRCAGNNRHTECLGVFLRFVSNTLQLLGCSYFSIFRSLASFYGHMAEVHIPQCHQGDIEEVLFNLCRIFVSNQLENCARGSSAFANRALGLEQKFATQLLSVFSGQVRACRI